MKKNKINLFEILLAVFCYICVGIALTFIVSTSVIACSEGDLNHGYEYYWQEK